MRNQKAREKILIGLVFIALSCVVIMLTAGISEAYHMGSLKTADTPKVLFEKDKIQPKEEEMNKEESLKKMKEVKTLFTSLRSNF